ncbi:hypothetical protein GCM10023194_43590 [Planotetraspora phitsanulokensis]|uniref:Uncharacterized protein n=1 Tax=Planotetraspora phitsanulokensis TaxID=575192 RepID=A0A8J3U4B5_9ACTN|nr:hypothetical protein Pph01_29640 [Planotetraspora phitsanulokensis]
MENAPRDPGIIDQYIEVAESLLDLCGGGHGRGREGDVERDRVGVAAGGSQRIGRFVAPVRAPGREQHRHAQISELSGDLVSDPLVRPGHQGDVGGGHRVVCHDQTASRVGGQTP